MRYLNAQLEAKHFIISIMLDNVELFGGQHEVDHKIKLLNFEIIQLNNQLEQWH